MRIMATITVPASTREYVKELKCDVCGKIFKGSAWTNKLYRIEDTEVKYKEGDNFPEGGSGTETIIDICPDCFKDKLIPWVKSFGVSNPVPVGWDW